MKPDKTSPKAAAMRTSFMLKIPKPAEPKPHGFTATLAALRAEHADLTAAIAALERLEARGR